MANYSKKCRDERLQVPEIKVANQSVAVLDARPMVLRLKSENFKGELRYPFEEACWEVKL